MNRPQRYPVSSAAEATISLVVFDHLDILLTRSDGGCEILRVEKVTCRMLQFPIPGVACSFMCCATDSETHICMCTRRPFM